jgi:ELWxxDGT repeat protein
MLLSLLTALSLSAAPAPKAPGVLVFNVYDQFDHARIMRTDGTPAGTALLHESCRAWLGPTVGRTTYFFAGDCTSGVTLWKTDGSRAGTVPVVAVTDKVAHKESYSIEFAILKGTPFLQTGSYPSVSSKLWRTDGTAKGTVVAVDLSRLGPHAYICGLTAWKDALYFWVRDDFDRLNMRLWRSDGTTAGSVEVAAFSPELTRLKPGCELHALSDALFFTTSSDAYPSQLWRTDGTAAGTALVRSFDPGGEISGLTLAAKTLFYRVLAVDGENWWKTDGVPGHEALVKTIALTGEVRREISTTTVGDRFFFSDSPPKGHLFTSQIWKSDGTPTGTALVKDLDLGKHPNDAPTDTILVGALGDTVFFLAENLVTDDRTENLELWKTDGTAAGTVLVQKIGWKAPKKAKKQ